MFRQDSLDNQDIIFLPFYRSAGQAAERQKASYLFEVRRSLIAQQNGNARGKAPIVDSSVLFSAKAELCFLSFIPARLASLPACQEIREADGRERCGQVEAEKKIKSILSCPVGPEDRTGVNPVKKQE